MQTILYIYSFIFGLVMASFLNALMYRLENEYKYPEIFTKSSHCEKCNKKLDWYDLIPVFSYIYSRGKCTNCGSKVNLYYPLSEFFLGLSVLLLFINSAPWYSYIVLMILFSLSYSDIHYKEIMRLPTLLFLGGSFLYLFIQSFITQTLIVNALLSALLLIVGILLILILMYGIKQFKEGFGFGDFLILLSVSAFLSTEKFWLMFWVSIFAAVIVSIIGFITKKLTRKSALPLLPFFTLGYIVVVTYGDVLLKYLGKTLAIF